MQKDYMAMAQGQQDQKEDGSTPEDFLISERRLGSLDHRHFFAKDGQLWGQLSSKWQGQKNEKKSKIFGSVERNYSGFKSQH